MLNSHCLKEATDDRKAREDVPVFLSAKEVKVKTLSHRNPAITYAKVRRAHIYFFLIIIIPFHNYLNEVDQQLELPFSHTLSN